MQSILIGDVRGPPSRQRTQVDNQKLHELKESIKREGLFHAIILAENNTLVAGATRLRAVAEIYAETGSPIYYDGKEVPFAQIPFTFTHKTDEASIFRIELEENLRREQLGPIDEAMALAKLHEMMQAAAPELVPGTGLKAPVTFKDTAIELGKITGKPQTNDAQKISDSILVEQWKDHPDVKRAKTLTEAARLARKAAERLFRETIGGAKLEHSSSRHRIIAGKCEEELPQLPDGFVDVIIADPPYGIGADSFGEQSLVGHEYRDTVDSFFQVFDATLGQANRICKPDAAMFIFMDILMWQQLTIQLEGWYIWPTPLIWYKPNRGHAPQPKRGPSRRYEAILYAIRGNREVRKVGTDVLTFNVPDDRLHGAGKPVGLYQELLSWVAYPGDVVLDPCAGSGTVIEAADLLDCSAIAVESDPASVALCRETLEKVMKDES